MERIAQALRTPTDAEMPFSLPRLAACLTVCVCICVCEHNKNLLMTLSSFHFCPFH